MDGIVSEQPDNVHVAVSHFIQRQSWKLHPATGRPLHPGDSNHLITERAGRWLTAGLATLACDRAGNLAAQVAYTRPFQTR